MSDFKVTPDTELTTAQMLERYQLNDESILRRWAKVHGINTNRGFYYPNEVDLLDHAHHHIKNLGMDLADYQNLLERRRYTPSQPVNGEQSTKGVTNQVADEAYNAIEMLAEQYSEAIDFMGERIADRFIDELDLSVMRHLAKKVRERRQINGQPKQPSRFFQVIKTVLQPGNDTLLVPKQKDDVSLELEHNHRLG